MAGDPQTRRLLWMAFAGTRGGPMRARIVALLRERPMNTNQLAAALGVDYKAAQHHLRVLARDGMVSRPTGRYAVEYSLTGLLEANMATFDEIAAKLEKSK